MEVVVPDLGDFADVEIIDVLVKPGDRVEPEQGLITLETEKATMDVPSPAAGRVKELKVKVGDRVSKGSAVLVLEQDGTDTAEAQRPEEDRTVLQPKLDARPEEDRTVLQPKLDPALRDAAGNGADGESVVETVRVPDLGDFSDVEIIEVLVKPGDVVAADQGLITLETEKATMDVPAPADGEVVELKVEVGDRVSTGDAVLTLKRSAAPQSAAATAQAPAPAATAPAAERAPPEAPAPPTRAPASAVAQPMYAPSFGAAHASPSVRKLARELGVDLTRVRGTGRKGRVRADDVKRFVKEALRGGGGPALPAVPTVDFAKFGPISIEPLSRIQKISGPRLHASWVNIPHVTQHDEADITELEQTRISLKEQAEERGIKLTPLAFVVRACVLALEEMPLFKASLGADGQSIVMKQYTHIGFAVDTPNGLVVPVIRDADKKDVYEIAKALAVLSQRARDGKLGLEDIQGGVFSISSLGSIGGRFFTPIINAPEVAILGVSRHQWQPVYRDGGFVPRLMLPLSLSYDHRVIDGANAVRFTTRLGELLADVGRLVEAIP